LFNSTPTDGLEITVGTNDLYAEDALYFNVSSIHVHEAYEQKTIKNDIAILKLTEKVIFDQEISSICLPEIDERTEDSMATVAGKVLIL
jgi:secreted trypsin-like serine protease